MRCIDRRIDFVILGKFCHVRNFDLKRLEINHAMRNSGLTVGWKSHPSFYKVGDRAFLTLQMICVIHT